MGHVLDPGVKSVDISLDNQVVRILGSATLKNLTAALVESGRNARLIGQGVPESECSVPISMRSHCTTIAA